MTKINLLPAEILSKFEGAPHRSVPLRIPIAFAVLFSFLYLLFVLYLYLVGPQLIKAKERALEVNKSQFQQVEALRDRAAVLNTRASAWQDVLSNRRSYRFFFKDLQRCLPVDMWLTEVKVSTEDQAAPQESGQSQTEPQESLQSVPEPTCVLIRGGTRSLASVGVYYNKLCALPYFKNLELKVVEEKGFGPSRATVFLIEAAGSRL